jgi:transcriptional regulator with XRE-family HTH domain
MKFKRKNKTQTLKRAGNPDRSRHNPHGMVDELLINQMRMLAEKGLTQREMAEFFNVGLSTVEYWLRNKPQLKQAVKEGRQIADAKVERSLYEKAIGYTTKEIKAFQYEGTIISEEFDKHYPPDTGSAIFWLKNRAPERWADSHALEHRHSGTITHKVEELPVHELPKEQQELLFNLNLKQLAQKTTN